jgi:hypothetical protein
MPPFLLLLITALLLAAAGCSSPAGTVQQAATGSQGAGTFAGPGNCTNAADCAAYCQDHRDACEQYCRDYPAQCEQFASAAGRPTTTGGSPLAGTACDDPAIRQKFAAVIERALVAPPASFPAPNWMTKILPADNPHPGYYYDLSTAFGPAVDTGAAAWSGEGQPPLTKGLDYYTVGYWEEIPKGQGGRMGEQSPAGVDLAQYQLAIFYANVSAPSQAGMISALPDLTMSGSEAKAFFASKIKPSFIDISGRTLTRTGPKMYEVRWHDSDNTQDYWDVQIGTGYIAIGQGRVYTEESLLAGDPGTMWRYHACRPCENCGNWMTEQAFNKDCTQNADCLGGLACNNGYCVPPGQGTSQPSGGGAAGNKGPGSPCTTAADCGTGLSCKSGVCSAPGSPP